MLNQTTKDNISALYFSDKERWGLWINWDDSRYVLELKDYNNSNSNSFIVEDGFIENYENPDELFNKLDAVRNETILFLHDEMDRRGDVCYLDISINNGIGLTYSGAASNQFLRNLWDTAISKSEKQLYHYTVKLYNLDEDYKEYLKSQHNPKIGVRFWTKEEPDPEKYLKLQKLFREKLVFN